MEKLFLKLLHAQSEEDVKGIIEGNELLNDSKNWVPYGGTFGNYSSFENQQSTAEGALMEKITNSIDAILVRQSLKKGIVPSSKLAPDTMNEAVSTFFTEDEYAAERVSVFVDGDVKSPNILVVDDGEGQEPDQFIDTLLSLQRGNKNNIKFVQGKFNMGSTGAAVFCGKHKYQLIASRRHSALSGNDQIGFTIVRKHVRTPEEQETMKNTWYEYFVVEGNVPRFQAENIELFHADNRFLYKEGTIVKMFNYKLNKKSAAFQVLKEEINNHLYYPAFPIEVHETRQGFKQVKERQSIMNISYGNGHLLSGGISSKLDESLEYKSLNHTIESHIFGEAALNIFVFKEENRKEASIYRGNKPVAFLMNGQVQYHLGTSYIANQLGFKLIKEHMIVSIDCTNLKKEFMDEGFFMANRETIRDTEETKAFLAEVTAYLKENKALIDLNKTRAAKKISSQGTQKLFERLLGHNQNDTLLRNLYQPNTMGANTKFNEHLEQDDTPEELKELHEFPSYMKLLNTKKDTKGHPLKVTTLGKNAKFTLELDAVNNYFSRTDGTSGNLSIKVFTAGQQNTDKAVSSGDVPNDVSHLFDLSKTSLENGEMDIALKPNSSETKAGDQYKVQISVSDTQNEFEEFLYIRFEQPIKRDPQSPKHKQREKLTLPPVIQVFKDQETIDLLHRPEEEKQDYETWEQRGWTAEFAREKIVEIAPGIDEQIASAIYINMSSPILNQIITEEGSTGINIERAQEQFLTNIYMQSVLISAAVGSLQQTKEEENNRFGIPLTEMNVESFVEELVKKSAYSLVKMQLNNIKSALA